MEIPIPSTPYQTGDHIMLADPRSFWQRVIDFVLLRRQPRHFVVEAVKEGSILVRPYRP